MFLPAFLLPTHSWFLRPSNCPSFLLLVFIDDSRVGIVVTRYLIRHSLKEERLTVAHVLRVQSAMMAKARQ